MNETWQIVSMGLDPSLLAQAQANPIQVPKVDLSNTGLETLVKNTSSSFGAFLPNLAGALLTLFVGWLVAVVLSNIVRGLLKKTGADNKIAGFITGNSRSTFDAEKLIGSIVFWVIFLMAVLAFLNALNLTVVAQPLSGVLNQVLAFVPKLVSAGVLAGMAWLLASAVRAIVSRTAGAVMPAMSRRMSIGDNQVLPSETLGNALYWFVFLFFLPTILQVLDLQGPLAPVQNLLNDFLSALPNVFKALLIGVAGWFIARTVREIVTNILAAAGTERLAAKIGLNKAAPGQSLSGLAGTVVYAMILIPTAVAALDALQIPAISGPATSMLNQVLNAIPQILTAGAIMAVAFFVSQFIGDLVSNLLAGLGFNSIFRTLGINDLTDSTSATPTTLTTASQSGTKLQPVATAKRTPAEVAGIVARVGVMLVAAIAATGVLNIPALTQLVTGLVQISGQVLSGIVVFAIGLYLANLAAKVVASSGSHQSQILSQVARLSILAFVGAMALQQMGIAPNIVNLAFGLLLGAIAIAVAISFGLGGRDVASEQLREWISGFREKK
jgi:Conserved TM helix